MDRSIHIRRKEFDKTSLNYADLYSEAIKYVQKLSGEDWTDYNQHDPGVTILEQLCYAITDVGYRTLLPVNDLLIKQPEGKISPGINAFKKPSKILSTHPVTQHDFRKLLIDRFSEIQNIWVITDADESSVDKCRGLNRIEILPKLNFQISLGQQQTAPGDRFLSNIRKFLLRNRNLGEDFSEVLVLEKMDIDLHTQIHINRPKDADQIIADVFLTLFEFFYKPVRHYSFDEMREAGYEVEEIFDGPRLKKGFIRNQDLGKKVETINTDLLQHIILKVPGVQKCQVFHIENEKLGTDTSMDLIEGHFFNICKDEKFDNLYNHLKVFFNNQEVETLNRDRITNIIYETWSKKYRQYPIGKIQDEFFNEKLNGTYRDPKTYYSIQNHFPFIYGIGREGLTANEPPERHAKAKQLKAYLLFFEKHLANQLCQLGSINEFFNAEYDSKDQTTFYNQRIDSITGIDELIPKDDEAKLYEDELQKHRKIFFERKNNIYDHLLARFGEFLSIIPWRSKRRLNIIDSDEQYQEELLKSKSDLIQNLEKIRINKGESFLLGSEHSDLRNFRTISGLEHILTLKTGIGLRAHHNQSLVQEIKTGSFRKRKKEKVFRDLKDFRRRYKSVDEIELFPGDLEQFEGSRMPKMVFGPIGLKSLYLRVLNKDNYKISVKQDSQDPTKVIFQKEPRKWVRLFRCDSEKAAVYHIDKLIAYFRDLNVKSEGFYIVDHILLNPFLEEASCGFCFYDELGRPLVSTIEDRCWVNNAKEREKRLKNLYKTIFIEGYLVPDGENWIVRNREGSNIGAMVEVNGRWQIKDNNNNIRGYFVPGQGVWQIEDPQEHLIATYHDYSSEEANDAQENTSKLTTTIEDIFYQLRPVFRLIHDPKQEYTEHKLIEVERFRLMGVREQSKGVYRPRKLVFQRRISSDKMNSLLDKSDPENDNDREYLNFDESGNAVIDEDFFNLRCTVLIPDWPARFQDERFKEYFVNLLHERTPVHMGCNVLSLDQKQMKEFESVYHPWEEVKRKADKLLEATGDLSSRSLNVYNKIIKFQRLQGDG